MPKEASSDDFPSPQYPETRVHKYIGHHVCGNREEVVYDVLNAISPHATDGMLWEERGPVHHTDTTGVVKSCGRTRSMLCFGHSPKQNHLYGMVCSNGVRDDCRNKSEAKFKHEKRRC